MKSGGPIILYDGVCGLCTRFNRFTLRRDRAGEFRFAALQSEFSQRLLERHGANPGDLDTVYVVTGIDSDQERLLTRSVAIFFVLRRLGGAWRVCAGLDVLPTPVLDLGYRLVARYRYRWFGRYPTCDLPEPRWRERFIATD